jgi:MoxR-like ATPase
MSEELIRGFAEGGYVLGPRAAQTLHLADALEKPVLVEGPPGVGKTALAVEWARHTGAELIRLQCYEGIDETRAIYEWSYGKQVLYSQLLRDQVRDITAGATSLGDAVHRLEAQSDAFFSEAFLLARPLLRALQSSHPTVLLIDEIDRADEEFEAFLLEVLGEFQITIPELGTIRAEVKPRVVLTSNDTRDLADALRRRCLYLHIEFPTVDEETAILAHRVPDLSDDFRRQLAAFVARVRKSDVRKPPGVSETIDWALALVAVSARDLSKDEIANTLGALLKNRDDIDTVLENLSSLKPL